MHYYYYLDIKLWIPNSISSSESHWVHLWARINFLSLLVSTCESTNRFHSVRMKAGQLSVNRRSRLTSLLSSHSQLSEGLCSPGASHQVQGVSRSLTAMNNPITWTHQQNHSACFTKISHLQLCSLIINYLSLNLKVGKDVPSEPHVKTSSFCGSRWNRGNSENLLSDGLNQWNGFSAKWFIWVSGCRATRHHVVAASPAGPPLTPSFSPFLHLWTKKARRKGKPTDDPTYQDQRGFISLSPSSHTLFLFLFLLLLPGTVWFQIR